MTKVSLRWRIVIAFSLIVLFVSGAFTLGIHQIFHALEDELMSAEMRTKLQLVADNPTHSSAHLNALGLQLFVANPPDPQLPDFLKHIPAGLTEIEQKTASYYAYRHIVNDQDYILLQDQSQFEDGFERNVFIALKSGFLLTVFLGGLMGWWLARQIIAPVIQLSEAFARREQQPLADMEPPTQFSDDEIGQLAHAFEHAYAKVKEALWRERLFTSDVSHEFRSGLMIISSSCELLLQGKTSEDPDYARIAKIARASAEMQQLIQSLLVVARAEHTITSSTAMQTPAYIAQTAFSHWQAAFANKQIALQLIENAGVAALTVNADLLSTALSNLLKNALNYTDSGHVDILVSAEAISVVDTGRGIELAQQAQLLQPFARGSHPLPDGMGLGLSLVQRICVHQGWHLQIHSVPAQGSTFTIRF